MTVLPYGVVSLLEVLKFAAEDFWKASQLLAKWRADALDVRPKYAVVETMQTLTVLLEHLRKLDLPVSVREFEKLNSDMGKSAVHVGTLGGERGKQAYLKLKEENCFRMDQMSSIIHSELESRVFFHVTPKEAAYYDQKELFGAEVNSKFSTIQYDMVEAGNCYAVGRGTSCVFHLMRIMEVGVRRFGAKLGVLLVDEKNWQNILDEINKAIKGLPPSPDNSRSLRREKPLLLQTCY